VEDWKICRWLLKFGFRFFSLKLSMLSQINVFVFVFYQGFSTTVDLLQDFNQNDSLEFNNTYSSQQGMKVFRNLSSLIVISIKA